MRGPSPSEGREKDNGTDRREIQGVEKKGRKAFVAYLTAGDPDLETTARLIPALEAAGVDILEIGVPFSDPTADGPVIQAASQRALKKGATLAKILAMIAGLRRIERIPIVLFGYYNPILSSGRKGSRRMRRPPAWTASSSSTSPPRRRTNSGDTRIRRGLTSSPSSPRRPIQAGRKILRRATGFVYYISVTGVTGTAAPGGRRPGSGRIKKMTALPVAVGFGISTPAQGRKSPRLPTASSSAAPWSA